MPIIVKWVHVELWRNYSIVERIYIYVYLVLVLYKCTVHIAVFISSIFIVVPGVCTYMYIVLCMSTKYVTWYKYIST